MASETIIKRATLNPHFGFETEQESNNVRQVIIGTLEKRFNGAIPRPIKLDPVTITNPTKILWRSTCDFAIPRKARGPAF